MRAQLRNQVANSTTRQRGPAPAPAALTASWSPHVVFCRLRCPRRYVRSLNRFTTGNPVAMGLRLMEKLCLKDNDRYCYARYRWREQATSQVCSRLPLP